MSQTTKKALAASLKKLLETKPLEKITVIDIIEDCEVNRQTFYYHFKDIYDLVEWIYTSEATKALDGKKTYDTWQQGFLQIFEYALKNKSFVINTYHSLNRDHLQNYLYNETYNLLIGVINEKSEGLPVREEDKYFIAHFYKFAFVGLVLEWVRTGMKDKPSVIIDHLSVLMEGNIPEAIEKFRTDKHFRQSSPSV